MRHAQDLIEEYNKLLKKNKEEYSSELFDLYSFSEEYTESMKDRNMDEYKKALDTMRKESRSLDAIIKESTSLEFSILLTLKKMKEKENGK